MSLPRPRLAATDDETFAGVRVFADYRKPVREACDVLVVGSGPAGAVAAMTLADAGIDVMLIEEGPPLRLSDIRLETGEAVRRLFREAGLRVSRGNIFMPTMQAIGLGGGSLVNSAICMRPPAWVFDSWAERHALPELADGALDPHFAEIEARLAVAPTEEAIAGERNLLFKRGCEALGLHPEPAPRNVRGCRGSGECLTGCRNRAKQSTDLALIPRALAHGARVLSSVRAEQLLHDGKRVLGVRGRVVRPYDWKSSFEVEIQARRVVLAAGCMATPCLLRNSDIKGKRGQVGDNLQAHPAYAVMGIFAHAVEPWKGATQGYHCLDFLREGLKLEVLWAPPALLAIRFPGSGLAFKEHLAALEHMAPFDVFVSAPHSRGRVRPRRGSVEPDIRFHVHALDMPRLQRGLLLLCDIFFAAGAKVVLPGIHGAPDALASPEEVRRFAAAPLSPTQAAIGSNHVFGTTPMGHDPDSGVVDACGRVFGMDNLYIVDTGIFPASPAVNPMHTCMALARRSALAMVDAG